MELSFPFLPSGFLELTSVDESFFFAFTRRFCFAIVLVFACLTSSNLEQRNAFVKAFFWGMERYGSVESYGQDQRGIS